MDKNVNDFKIAGSGIVPGGVYNLIRINGAGKILDNIEANEIRIAGALKALGSLNAKTIKVTGSCKVEKDLKGENIRIAGSAKVIGNIEGEEIIISGSIACDGDINGEKIEINSINSELNNIYGENIFIGENKPKKRWFRKHEHNKIDTIEATNIELNSCKVKVVRGKSVIIGKDCEIDLIEYQDKFEFDKSSKVKETIKI